MPIYEYSCGKCGTFEINQSISEETLKRCPKCRSKVTKLISASAFHLKGGGWYADAYQKKSSSDSSPSPSTSSTTSPSKDTAAKTESSSPAPASSSTTSSSD